VLRSEFETAKQKINKNLLILDIIVNKIYLIAALMDIAYFCYAAVSENFVWKNAFKRVAVTPRKVGGATKALKAIIIEKMAYGTINVKGFEYIMFVYVILGL
jgi:hypothetical protein